MMTIIGVRFRTAGKIYYFDPAGREIKTGDQKQTYPYIKKRENK